MKGLQRDYHDSSDISRAYGNSATFPDLPRFTEAHAVPDDRSESDSTISAAAQINEYSWVASPADNSALSHQTLKGNHILWGVLSLLAQEVVCYTQHIQCHRSVFCGSQLHGDCSAEYLSTPEGLAIASCKESDEDIAKYWVRPDASHPNNNSVHM